MDAQTTLDVVLGLSTQVEDAVLIGADGQVAAGSAPGVAAETLGTLAGQLLARAGALRGGLDVEYVHVSSAGGDVFALQAGGRIAAALAVPEATAGLVLYDLRAALERWEGLRA